jgi:hypothetical protein
MPRPRVASSRRCSHWLTASPDAILGRETQSRLARGQPRAGDTVTARPRPLREGDAVTPHPRPTSGGRRSHASPVAILGRETQSRLHASLRPSSGGRRSHGSLEATLGRETQVLMADIYKGHFFAMLMTDILQVLMPWKFNNLNEVTSLPRRFKNIDMCR